VVALHTQSAALGLRPWRQPDLRVQRWIASNEKTQSGFLSVAKESMVIERGDLVHIDFGLVYMGK